MIDDISDIKQMYDSALQKEHKRLVEHQLEWDLTWRYLEEYLPQTGNILEIGAGTGRYTVELAKRGYIVTAVDLSDALIEFAKQRVASENLEAQVDFIVADARDLSSVACWDYSSALLMGPLYHLVIEEDRRTAIQQVHERLRRDGILFTSFISRLGILGELIRDHPQWIMKQVEVRTVMERGRDPDHHPKGGFRGYFTTVQEIAPLHEEIGFETLVVAGVEPAISADDPSYNRLEGSSRRAWLDLLYEISREPTIVGASRHLLYVGRKI